LIKHDLTKPRISNAAKEFSNFAPPGTSILGSIWARERNGNYNFLFGTDVTDPSGIWIFSSFAAQWKPVCLTCHDGIPILKNLVRCTPSIWPHLLTRNITRR
jgi:hypothetical protein